MSGRWCAGPFVVVLLLLGAFLLGSADRAAQGVTQVPAPGDTARAAEPFVRRPPDLRATPDYRASVMRTVILGVALVVLVLGIPRTDGSTRVPERAHQGLLVLLALVSLASYYQFFRFEHPEGFATTDNFHYYVGSKYFPELGYFGLYECSLVAMDERGVRLPRGHEPRARDLRSMDIWPAAFVRKHGEDCPERFSAERWAAFRSDVAFFVEKWPPHIRSAVWSDHGYHPPPAWTWIGGTVASLTSLDDDATVALLGRVDRILLVGTFLFLAFAFGTRTACLAAILFGTGHLWRYTWLGDAFLRHLWLIVTFLAIGALRRGANGWGGAGLATAALLRVFPGAFATSFVVHGLRRAYRDRTAPPDLTRFLQGALLGALGITVASLLWIGGGLDPVVGFAAKIGEFTRVAAANKMGLGVLTSSLLPDSPWLAGSARLLFVGAFAVAYWRGLRDVEPWEAAAFGFALIPVLSDPTNYYYSFFAVGSVLALRRPWIGAILVAACLAFGVNGLVLYRTYAEYPAASAIALLAVAAVALAMSTPSVSRSGPARREAAATNG